MKRIGSPFSAIAFVAALAYWQPAAGHKIRTLIMKALEIDDSLAEGYAALATLKLFIEWDWDGAEREFKRSMELNPTEEAHLLYPDLLLIDGRAEEAIAMSKVALENDPLSPRTGKALAWAYYYSGQYDNAIEQFNKTRELFPNYIMINLGPSYERKGVYDLAIKEYLDAEARSGMRAAEIANLRQAYVTSGWRGYWKKRLDLAKAESKRKPLQSIFLAQLYAHLGEKERALESLERAYEERNMSLVLLKVDPAWESLRSEPRFQDLLRRMRLA